MRNGRIALFSVAPAAFSGSKLRVAAAATLTAATSTNRRRPWSISHDSMATLLQTKAGLFTPTAWIFTDEGARGNESQIHVCVFHDATFLCSAIRRCARNSLPINFLPPIESHPRHVRFGSLTDISTRPNAARSKRTSVPGRVMTSVVSNADRERAGTTATHYMLS